MATKDASATATGLRSPRGLQTPSTTSTPCAEDRRQDSIPVSVSVETEIAQIWCQLLGLGEIGLDDNFFEVGGNSLLALRSSAEMSERLHRLVHPTTVLKYPTVNSLGAVVRLIPVRENIHSMLGRTSAADEVTVVCSPTQSFFLYFSAPHDDVWMNRIIFRVSGMFVVQAFARSVELVVERHTPLRTIFASSAPDDASAVPGVNISSYQHVLPVSKARVYEFHDVQATCSGADDAGSHQAVLDRIESDDVTNIDITASPAFRIRVYQSKAKEWFIAMEAHHAAVDGSSWELLYGELRDAYAVHASSGAGMAIGTGTGSGAKALPPPIHLSYPEWTVSRMKSVLSLQSQHAFHQVIEKLRGYEDRGTTIPTTHERDLSDGWHLKACQHREITVEVAPMLLKELQELASHHGCSLFVAVVSVFHAWQHYLTGKTKVSLMISSSWRDALSERLIGSFLTDMVLVADVNHRSEGASTPDDTFSSDPSADHTACTFVELLKQAQQCHRFMAEHTVNAPLATWNSIFPESQSLPYAILLNFISKEWNTEFELDGATVEEVESDTEEMEETGAAESELDIEFDEETGEMTWTYNTSLYDAATVKSIAALFVQVLNQCVKQPDDPLASTANVFTDWMATDLPPAPLVVQSIRAWQNSMHTLMNQSQ